MRSPNEKTEATRRMHALRHIHRMLRYTHARAIQKRFSQLRELRVLPKRPVPLAHESLWWGTKRRVSVSVMVGGERQSTGSARSGQAARKEEVVQEGGREAAKTTGPQTTKFSIHGLSSSREALWQGLFDSWYLFGEPLEITVNLPSKGSDRTCMDLMYTEYRSKELGVYLRVMLRL